MTEQAFCLCGRTERHLPTTDCTVIRFADPAFQESGRSTSHETDTETKRLHEDVMSELLSCYGEGEDTDWPYLNDLADLIVSMIEKHLGGS